MNPDTAYRIGPDVAGMREDIYSLMHLETAASVLDIGCGRGYDLVSFGKRCGKDAVLTGIDTSGKAIREARERTGNDPRFSVTRADASSGLPFGDNYFDIVYSGNLLECVRDKDALISEVYRVIKPGGQVIFSHYDWDSQIINGSDKTLIRRIVAAFSDWKQDWMAESDGWMGRRMAGLFKKNPGFSGEVIPFVLVNTEYDPVLYGYQRIGDFEEMAQRGLITASDHAAFQRDLEETIINGEYFYSITLYVYMGTKKPAMSHWLTD
ncbi:MAG: methyltransferase domain-containing protein, partial [Methanospirillum sp.]|nr:methyltransferase domain-containing protein [Methanospirillum sp.]